MSPLHRLWNAVRRAQLDREVGQEVDAHLAMIEEEERSSTDFDAVARRRARVRFGSPLLYREKAVDAVSAPWLEAILKDAGFAVRRLLRNPMFTAASLATLALAIGANVAIFAVVDRVVLRPLPYPDSDRIITLEHGAPGRNIPSGINGMPLGLYYQYLDRAASLEHIALTRVGEMTLTGQAEPERVRVARSAVSLAAVLQIVPVRGRWFTEAESAPGADAVAVISHGLWTRRYGASGALVGSSVTLNGIPTTVVGIAPPWLAYPDSRIDVWTPYQLARSGDLDEFSDNGVARMRPGVTADAARDDLNRAIADLPAAYAGQAGALTVVNDLRLTSTAKTLKEATVGETASMLWILMGSVGVVLLVACANVANLFLVRAEARQREVAVRQALGAGRAGIARYFLSESVVLSLAGGAIGVPLAWAAVRILVAFGPASLPRSGEIAIGGTSVAAALVLSLAAALMLGLIPLLHGAPIAASLAASGRSHTSDAGRMRVRRLLMGGQVALALVLLIASGLLVRSFQRLRATDPGFDASSAITFRLALPPATYADRAAVVAAHQRIAERLADLPGVTSASATTLLPLSGVSGYTSPLFVAGRDVPPGTLPPSVVSRAVAGDFMTAMRMRLVRGRGIERSDIHRGNAVAVVNDAVARQFFPGEDPVGQRVRVPPLATETWLTIVGVVANSATRTLAERAPVPTVYIPLLAARVGPPVDAMTYVVRTASPPGAALPAIRGAIRDVDPGLALANVRTLEEILREASATTSFVMVLLAVAAAGAVLLGSIGVYAVMSYVVSQRRPEIGVRLALGAAPSSVSAMIRRQGAGVVLAGLGFGLAATLAGARIVESQLYGIGPRDPLVIAVMTLVLLAVSLVACWFPARRAARLTPLDALRVE